MWVILLPQSFLIKMKQKLQKWFKLSESYSHIYMVFQKLPSNLAFGGII